MPADPTTLIDVAPALVAGSVGLVSAVLSYTMARYQIAQLQREHQSNREFQMRTTSVERRHDALERLWALLWCVEESGALSQDELSEFIRCLVWLPFDLRTMAIDLASKVSRRETFSADDIARIRRAIVAATDLSEGAT